MNDNFQVLVYSSFPLTLCMLIVAVDAFNRFRVPFVMRSQTTWLRYWLVNLIYMLVYLIVFYICSVFQLKFYLSEGIDSFYGSWGSIEKIYLLSAFFVVLLPKLPFFKQVDLKFGAFLRGLGGIPFKAQQMANMLHHSDYVIPRGIRGDIEEKIGERGIASKHINYQNDHSPQYVYTRLSSLIVQIERMRQDRKFANFLSKADDKLSEIYTLYDKISYRAAKLFDLSQELFAMSGKRTGASTDLLEMDEMYGGDMHESNPVDSSLSEIKSYFLEQAAQLEKRLFFFISMASLYCCLSTSSRKKHLSRMGFSVTAEAGTTWLAYIIPMLLLFPVFGVLFFFTYYGSSSSQIFQSLMMVSMITLTYTVAVGVAVCIKTRLWFANIFYQNFKSIRAVVSIAVSSVIIGAIAILFVLPVIVFFKFFLSGGNLNSVIWDIVDNTYPWLILPGTAAFITAVMIDENYLMMFRTEKSGTRRWIEGVLSAVALAVAMLIVHPLLKDQAPDAPLAALVLAQSLAGVIIGLSIPHWYRARYKHPKKTGYNSSFSLRPSSELGFQSGLK